MSDLGWTPVTKGLPKDLEEVIVTWVNTNPESYYSDIEGIPFSGAAVFYDDNWYWYSDLTQDILAEYGRCENMLIEHDKYVGKTDVGFLFCRRGFRASEKLEETEEYQKAWKEMCDVLYAIIRGEN